MAIFDKDAPIYDAWFDMKLGKYVNAVETVIAFDLLKPQKGMRILDIGCGTGNFSIKLAKLGCEVTGIDVSEEMLKKAKENAAKESVKITFINKDILELSFKDAFDGVCSNTALEFIQDKETAISLMLKSVKKGGPVVVGTINKDSLWFDFYEDELKKENSFFAIFKYATFISKKEMERLCKDNLETIKNGLFISPNIEESLLDINNLEREINEERGGYICGLWRK